MNGTGLLYKDQETAEAKADEWRNAHKDLLARLRNLNKSVDSLALHELILDAEFNAPGLS